MVQPSSNIEYPTSEVIPVRVALLRRNPFQKLLGIADSVGIEQLSNIRKLRAALIGVALASIALAGVAVPCAVALLLFALALNLVIRLVDFLHLFLCQIRQRIVGIVVRVIFSCQLPISSFNLFIGSARRNPQHLIWICHLLLPSLYLVSSFIFARLSGLLLLKPFFQNPVDRMP